MCFFLFTGEKSAMQRDRGDKSKGDRSETSSSSLQNSPKAFLIFLLSQLLIFLSQNHSLSSAISSSSPAKSPKKQQEDSQSDNNNNNNNYNFNKKWFRLKYHWPKFSQNEKYIYQWCWHGCYSFSSERIFMNFILIKKYN